VSAFQYEVAYTEQRNRLTTAFRYILAIPHLLLVAIWGWLAEAVSVVQWFIVLFTGKRNQSLWDLQWGWLDYASRVNGYVDLLYDPYPAFGSDPGPVPVTTAFSYESPADRLTNGLRFIWAIPALVISAVLGFAMFFVVVVAWFAILFTGKQPRGMFDFTYRVVHYILQTNSYVLLMTDTYPNWNTAGSPSGPAIPSTGTPPPPPPAAAPPAPPTSPPPHPPTAPPGAAPPPPPA
jgi:Domain of unknown function (DUF4389)